MDAPLTYNQVVSFLEKRSVMPDRPLDLKRVQEGFKRLIPKTCEHPEKTILVAGTNGKGSVCATLEALLLSTSHSVGLYTSPHLQETRERIRLNGEMISEELFVHAYCIINQFTSDLFLSHFETLTLMASWLFFVFSPVSWSVFEVGLGGTWDATNVIPHDFSVITSINFDHEKLLGSTLREIAMNKWGIIHPHNHVFSAVDDPDLQTLQTQGIQQKNAHYHPLIPYHPWIEITPEGPSFFIDLPEGRGGPLTLPGKRGISNTALALTVFQQLGFPLSPHLSSLKKVFWPGRMEKIDLIHPACSVFLSGDHNPAGIKSFIDLLAYYPCPTKRWILFGVSEDKNYQAMLEDLTRLPETNIVLTETPFKARKINEFGKWSKKVLTSIPDPINAFHTMISSHTPPDSLFVTGSLYLVGHIRKYILDICKKKIKIIR